MIAFEVNPEMNSSARRLKAFRLACNSVSFFFNSFFRCCGGGVDILVTGDDAAAFGISAVPSMSDAQPPVSSHASTADAPDLGGARGDHAESSAFVHGRGARVIDGSVFGIAGGEVCETLFAVTLLT